MKKKAVISSIITAVCIAAAVILWFAVNNVGVEYTQVKASVVSSEERVRRVYGKTQRYYEVVVEYEGREYDLQNVYSSSSYIPGWETTVYLHDNKLYANVAGITSTTPVATVYFVFLFASVGMLVVTGTLFSKARQEKQAAG